MEQEIKLYDGEYRFASIVWANEPIASGALAKLCEQDLGWKRSTTYTVLKRLCNRGILQNVRGTVTSQVSQQEVRRLQSDALLRHSFDGSLPLFLTTFFSGRSLSHEQAEEFKAIIDRVHEGQAK